MPRTLSCLWDGCNGSFLPDGNRRYCSDDCRVQARRVQNRRAQRRHRLRDHAGDVTEAVAEALRGRLDLSAVRLRGDRFRLPMRPVPPAGDTSRAPARGLLLEVLS